MLFRSGLGGELGVVGWREAPPQVLEDVEGQTAHQGDDRHFPQERHRGDEVHVWNTEAIEIHVLDGNIQAS